MTIVRVRRTLRALPALAAATALAAGAAHAASDPRPVAPAPRSVLTRTNTELLVTTARAVAHELADRVPLAAGARVALQPEGHDPVDTDVSEAMLLALNARGFECVVLPAPAVSESAAAAVTSAALDSASAGPPPTGAGAREAYLRLQEERRAQKARADSLAALAIAHPPATAQFAAASGLPLLTYRVAEGRVDYVRVFRSGVFGSERIERRATTRVTLKLRSPGTDAVRWSTSADTTLGDVVSKAELAALEDRLRPETRPIPPQSNLKKIVEPTIVVALIAGLVALFYQNRP